jgi:NAD(P)-dependent dehydrogenase (short-subunit alcohol dehydrogenase family)
VPLDPFAPFHLDDQVVILTGASSGLGARFAQVLHAAGATVVMVSSDIDRLLTVTDRVGMMYKGRLIFDGTTEEEAAQDSRPTLLHRALLSLVVDDLDVVLPFACHLQPFARARRGREGAQ